MGWVELVQTVTLSVFKLNTTACKLYYSSFEQLRWN